jgi:hypothetical protein
MGDLTADAVATTDANLALPPGVRYDGDYRLEGSRRIYDPDHDGDDDSSAEGDTDHDYVLPDGSPGPSARRVTQGQPLSVALVLEGDVPRIVTLEKPSAANGGVMKMRVPFYIGGSVAKAPGIKKPIYFAKELLPSIVAEGKRQIAEGKQPITVYARHALAADGGNLPAGIVADLEQEGSVGYATLEISPTITSGGKDLQVLAENKHINAVSLRSGAGRFEMKDVLVNEQPMLTPTKLLLDGIDFAPDGPAQATYGLEILQEARVIDEPPSIEKPNRRVQRVSDLTLEALKADSPSLVAEIEAPLRQEILTVKAERDALLAEKTSAARKAKLEELAARFPKPDEALPILLELCKDCQTDDEVALKAFPVLLEALGEQKAATEDPRSKLLDMFKNSGRGQSVVQEHQTDELDLPAGTDLAAV